MSALVNDDVSVVVVAGGRGERLRPLSDAIPKVLLPLDEDTVLDHILRGVVEVGIVDVHIMLGRHAPLVEAYLKIRPEWRQELSLTLHLGTGTLGTAGPLRCVKGRPGPWVIINGDLATDISILDVLTAHRESGADLTAVGVDHQFRIPFGVFTVDERGRIQTTTEKPIIRSVVSAGLNILGPVARERLSPSGAIDMTELMDRCVSEGLDVRVYRTSTRWFDVGTMDGYAEALRAFGGNGAVRDEDIDV